ncbi:MAG: YerC/YecD family TrpR-related protein [Oscillospiraceae bacterium]|nr:YerC/YecD family TrpR-related protein [Oscillospiraceae bacterium]
MNKSNRKTRNELMYEAILSLKDKDECIRFFDDLCTVSELQAMEQRFQVAWLLDQGMIYNDILRETGASSATISRVKRSLEYGQDGYAVVFERLKEEESGERE